MKKQIKSFFTVGTLLICIYGMMKIIAIWKAEDIHIDDDNPYFNMNRCKKLKNDNESKIHKNANSTSFYEKVIKPMLDQILSFGGLILFAPFYILISVAVYLDDPGDIFFVQKRVGKDGHYFMLHKYRSMKMSTPHDVPTHQLRDAEQYITRVGKILRKTSLDELPQIWDIFRGKMSIIGPRPALWNQEDLIKEREKYGANAQLPGLTGLAQIKGRDELLIPDKAKIDGEYAKILHNGGIAALRQDINCFIATFGSVLRHEGIIEGGTGNMSADNILKTDRIIEIDPFNVGFDDYGYKKKFNIDPTIRKKVLITGAGSYIGESFIKYAMERYPNIETHTLNMEESSWRNYDFRGYDVVFHVAGIAHADVGHVNKEIIQRYYTVNTELALETARIAKAAGISQFIFMSSMIVYGDSAPYGKQKIIDEYTIPIPSSFYGDSKWQADKGIRKLASDTFKVAVLRPPMVYGKESRGNYSILAKFVKMLPVFPNVENLRSMIYIDNLCEFLCLLICSGKGGIYFPQNADYTTTAKMAKEIGAVTGHSIKFTKLLNPSVKIASHVPGKISGLVNKAFGNIVYSQLLSSYDGMDYRIVSLKESVIRTES